MVGKRIAKLRKERGCTQADLAKGTGLSKGYIAAIEEGKKIPHIKTLVIIAEFLDVGIRSLIGEG